MAARIPGLKIQGARIMVARIRFLFLFVCFTFWHLHARVSPIIQSLLL